MASNHSNRIDFKYFMKLHKDLTREPYSILVNEMIVSTNNPL